MAETSPDTRIAISSSPEGMQSPESRGSREVGSRPNIGDGLVAGLAVIKCKSCPVRAEKPEDWLCPWDIIELAAANESPPEPGTPEALLLRVANNTQIRCTEAVEAGVDPIIIIDADQFESFKADQQSSTTRPIPKLGELLIGPNPAQA